MADDTARQELGEDERERQEASSPGWRPSRLPDHRFASPSGGGRIVERSAARGPLSALVAQLRKPRVRVLIGVGLFVAGAIAVDANLDSSWAQRDAPAKPNKHASSRVPSG